jgi:hypothetical protein
VKGWLLYSCMWVGLVGENKKCIQNFNGSLKGKAHLIDARATETSTLKLIINILGVFKAYINLSRGHVQCFGLP